MSIRTAPQTSAIHKNTFQWAWLVIAIGWGVALLATFSGQDWVLNHHILIEGGLLPLPLAALVFLFAWQLMTITMMLPSSLSFLTLFGQANRHHHGGRTTMAVFLAGYLVTWTWFGVMAFAGDILVHQLLHQWSWLAWHPWMIAGTTLLLAGSVQFTPAKRRFLAHCRLPRTIVTRQYRTGRGPAWWLGLEYGRLCLGCSWALMVMMFGLGMGNVLWMAGLGGLVFLEKSSFFEKYLVPGVGIILLAWGFLVLAHPGWLPRVLTGLA